MKKVIVLSTVLLCCAMYSFGLGYEWLGLNNSFGNYKCTDLVYHNDYLYGIGEFTDYSIIIGGITLTNSSTSGTSDIFVFKADTLGTVIWAQKFGGIDNESSNNMAVDNAGNALVTGSFEGTGVFGTTSLTSNGGKDVFILRLNNTTGNTLWARNVGNSADDYGNDICADFNDDIYVISTLKDQITFAGNTASQTTSFPGILKYDKQGNEIWFKYVYPYNATTIFNDVGVAIKYDARDSAVVFSSIIYSNGVGLSYSTISSAPLLNTVTFYASIKYDSSIITGQAFSSGSFTRGNRDLVVDDSSQYFLAVDVRLLTNFAPAAYIHFDHPPLNNYTLGYGDPFNFSLTHVSIPKITGSDSIYYGILETSNSSVSPCYQYSILKHAKYSYLNRLQFGGYNFELLSLTSGKNNSLYVGGKNRVGKVCFQPTCPVLPSIPTLSINPAPDITTCPGNYNWIGLPFCDYIVGGSPPYTFAWTPNTNITYTNQSRALVNPSTSTTYYLTVTDASNNVVYDTVNVFTTLTPQVSITSLSPLTDTICPNDTVHFQIAYTGTPASYHWGSSFGTNWFNLLLPSQTDSSAIGVATNNIPTNFQTGSINFGIIDSQGCVQTATSQIVIKPVTNGLIGYGTSTPNLTICSGDSITLWGTGGIGGTVYTWSSGTSSFGIQDSVSFTPPTGYHNLTVQDVSSCLTTTANLTVNPSPSFNINSSPSTSPLNICAGDTVSLWASNTPPAYQYTWNGGITNNVAFTPNNSFTYVVTATNAYNCSQMDSIEVTVNNPPPVIANSSTNQSPATICVGDSLILYGSGAANYTWTGGITDSIAFYPVSNQTYTVIGTDSNGCIGMDSIELSIATHPIDTILSYPPILCYGDSVALGAVLNYCTPSLDSVGTGPHIEQLVVKQNTTNLYSNSTGDGPGDYNIYIDSITLSTGINYTLEIRRDAATINSDSIRYRAAWIDYNRNGSFQDSGEQVVLSTNAQPQTIALNFTIPSLVTNGYTVMRIGGSTNTPFGPCKLHKGEYEDYVIKIIGGQPIATQFTWSPSSQLIDTLGAVVTSTNLYAPTTFSVRFTDTNNCVFIDTINIIPNPLPTPIITFSTDTLYCGNVNNIANYTWTLGGSTVGTNDSVLVITQNGQYVIQVTDSGGCIGYDTLQVTNLSTAGFIGLDDHIVLYPNPSSGLFTIKSDQTLNAKIEVYDILGKQLALFDMNQKQQQFNISSFANGDYIIRIVTKERSYIYKLTVDH